jgi:hypothetical protein
MTTTATPAAKDPRQFVTPDVRLSFPSLFKKKETFRNSGRFVYSTTLLVPPTAVKPFRDAMAAAVLAKFGPTRVSGLKNPLRPCEEKEFAGYEPGWFFCTAKSDGQPPIVNQARLPVTDESRVYAGLWVRCALSAWCYANESGKGVSFDLRAVQIIKDDERLDGRSRPVNPDDVFEALELPPEGGDVDADWSPF